MIRLNRTRTDKNLIDIRRMITLPDSVLSYLTGIFFTPKKPFTPRNIGKRFARNCLRAFVPLRFLTSDI